MQSQAVTNPLSARRSSQRRGRPGSYEALAERITERFPDLPRQLQRIARFALDAPEEFALGTAAQLAKQIGVQPSALVRFAGAIGCDGFAEMRQLFRTQLRARTLSYRERIERLQSRAPKATAPCAVFRAQSAQAIEELQRFQHAIDDLPDTSRGCAARVVFSRPRAWCRVTDALAQLRHSTTRNYKLGPSDEIVAASKLTHEGKKHATGKSKSSRKK